MHPYPKHLDGFDYRGRHRYFLTFCTDQRRPFFSSAARVALVELYFLRAARELEFADLAHCFMPDHFHTVVEGRSEDSDARALIARAKQYTAYYFKRNFHERLWQRYGYEHVIRDKESTQAVIRYLLENPVRGGLVADVTQYPFIGSSEYAIDQLIEFCRDSETSA